LLAAHLLVTIRPRPQKMMFHCREIVLPDKA
jgi:hypothetical protein